MSPIQILPQVPNFGSQLAQVLGQAGTNIGQGLLDRNTMTQLQDPNLTSMQKIALISSLPKEKAAAVATMYAPMLKEESKMAGMNKIFGTFGQTNSTDTTGLSPTENENTTMNQTSNLPSWDSLSKEQQFMYRTFYPAQASGAETESYHNKKMGQVETLAKEARAYDENKPFLTKIEAIKDSLPTREANSIMMNSALSSGDTNTIRNFAADYLGKKGLSTEWLSSANANDLKSAVKTQFVSDLKSLPTGARLNQLIESNLMGALESPLKTPESNQTVKAFTDFQDDVDKEKVNIVSRLKEEYASKGKELPMYASNIVDTKLRPYVDKRLKQLDKEVSDIKKGVVKNIQAAKEQIKGKFPSSGNVWMLIPTGEIKEIPKNMVNQATEAGGTLIK
jgi:hypothetical protein